MFCFSDFMLQRVNLSSLVQNEVPSGELLGQQYLDIASRLGECPLSIQHCLTAMEQALQHSRDISKLDQEAERAQQNSVCLKEDQNALTEEITTLQGQLLQARNDAQAAKAQGDRKGCSALQLQVADISAEIENCQKKMTMLKEQSVSEQKRTVSSSLGADNLRDAAVAVRLEHEVQAQAVWADLNLARLHMSAADTEHAEMQGRKHAEATQAIQMVLIQQAGAAREASLALRRAGKGREAIAEMTRSVHLEAEAMATGRKAQSFTETAVGHQLEAKNVQQKIRWQREECDLIGHRKGFLIRLKLAAANLQETRLTMGAQLSEQKGGIPYTQMIVLEPSLKTCNNHSKKALQSKAMQIAEKPVRMWTEAVEESVMLQQLRRKHHEALLHVVQAEKSAASACDALQKASMTCNKAKALFLDSRPNLSNANQLDLCDTSDPSEDQRRVADVALALLSKTHAPAVAVHKQAKQELTASKKREASARGKAQTAENRYNSALDCAQGADTLSRWWLQCTKADQDVQEALKLAGNFRIQEQVVYFVACSCKACPTLLDTGNGSVGCVTQKKPGRHPGAWEYWA
jgi:hypothetical protein